MVSSPNPPAEPPATVLVVDDEPSHLQLAAELLRSGGLRVRTAGSGELGLQLARASPPPELVLLDVSMPGLDGPEVLRRLQADPRTADIPVLFVSAHADDTDVERGLALGAADYITKPLRLPLLLARVRTQLQAARERERLRRHNRRLEARCRAARAATLLTRKAGLRAMAHLAELRDPETGDHLLRTQASVRQLALQLRRDSARHSAMDDDWIELLVESAPLHDIGKVGIPDPVLLKPGPLTEAEQAVMRTHTTIGAQAIERAEQDVGGALPYFTVARQVALSHHERWDGRGYPQGLAGHAIPLAARIMAVADVFDALISSRVYKRPLPVAEARRLILADAGSRFDPEVVAAFDAVFDRLVAIAQASAASAPVLPAAA